MFQVLVTELGWLALFSAGIAAFITTVLVLSARSSKRLDEQVQASWKAFARERGLRWKDATGLLRSKSYEVHGESSGVHVRLRKHVVNTGKSPIVYTRAIGRLSPRLEHKLSVGQRSLGTKLAEALGHPPIATGDADFDARMALRSRSRDAALAIVSARAREHILCFPKQLSLECKGNEARLSWRGAESDPQVLSAALALLAALCGADVGSPTRPNVTQSRTTPRAFAIRISPR